MQGDKKVIAKNKNNYYEFILHRNITILKGDSGRGKTKLFELIADYNKFGKSSDAKVSCECPVIAYDGRNWQNDIKEIKNSIVIVDEENSNFINSVDFAKTIKGTDNYYLLITRNYLPNLPYSVTEIYELSGKGKNKKFVNRYSSKNYMYSKDTKKKNEFIPNIVITEDEKSGYQFWGKVGEENSVKCVTAKSKTAINNKLNEYKGEKVLVIADGAAFGPEMERLMLKQEAANGKIAVCLPECFEWLLLASGILEHTDAKMDVDYTKIRDLKIEIESKDYFSWEQFYENMLKNSTKDSRYCKYTKAKLTAFYIKEENIEKVLDLLKEIKFKK